VVLRLALVALALALALALVAGCVQRAPLARLDQATPIMLVVLADDADGARAVAAPPELAGELVKRNLVVEAAPAPATAALTGARDSKTRSELLAKELGPGKLFLLVELRATFFAQMQGAWKWNVDAQLTVARSDGLAQGTSASQHTPVFLDSESDGAREAFEAAGPSLSDRIGRLLDDHFAGHGATVAPPPPPTPP
jgi:hypothetical protein